MQAGVLQPGLAKKGLTLEVHSKGEAQEVLLCTDQDLRFRWKSEVLE